MLHLLGFEAASRAARPLAWLLGGVVVLVLSVASAAAPATGAANGGMAPLRSAVVTQGFGCTTVALEPLDAGCPSRHFHSGIDLAAPAGTPVYSVTAGTASVIAATTGYGLHVLVDGGNGMVVLYGHLAGAAVESGALVSAGALIGWVGSTGNSTGPHLHFEVRRFGAAVDPSAWLPAYGGLNSQGGHHQW